MNYTPKSSSVEYIVKEAANEEKRRGFSKSHFQKCSWTLLWNIQNPMLEKRDKNRNQEKTNLHKHVDATKEIYIIEILLDL